MNPFGFVDSGALFHLTPKRYFLSYYAVIDNGYVKMGDDDPCKIIGIDNVWLLTSTSYKMLLKDACHIPDIRTEIDIDRTCR